MAVSHSLPILEHWQDFETLCCDLWRQLWKDPNTQINGRRGQAQKGIDIYGRPNQGNEWAGVQCKHKEQLVGARLTRKEIVEAVKEARNFKPPLSQLAIATTSPRDARLQESVRKIDDAERKAGAFSVTVFFWQDIVSNLQDFPELLRKFYPIFYFQPQLRPEAVGEPAAATGLEVELKVDDELDYVGLVPAYSSVDPTQPPDLTVLAAGLSHIEVTNHDDLPTEIQRLWLSIEDPLTQTEMTPVEVNNEELRGNRRIGARSHQQYALSFDAVFAGASRKEWRQRVVLRVKAIGFGERRIRLDERLWLDSKERTGPNGP